MAEITSIVQELIYETDTSSFEAIDKAFGKQFSQIKDLQAQQAALQKQIDQTNAKDIAAKTALNAALNKNKAQIDKITVAIGQEFAANEKLNKSFVTTGKQAQNLGFAFSQLTREAPAFAFSAQTGILALSNNIPILLDQLTAARKAGASTTDIFKTLGASLFSITGILTIAVSVLTIFGDELFSSADSAEKAEDKIDKLTTALDEYIKKTKEFNAIARSNQFGLTIGGASEADLQRELEQMKARGDSADAIAEQEKKISASRQTSLKLLQSEFKTALDFIKQTKEAQLSGERGPNAPLFSPAVTELIKGIDPTKAEAEIRKRFDEINDALANEENKVKVIQLTRQKEIRDERKKILDQQAKDIEDYIKKIKKLFDTENKLVLEKEDVPDTLRSDFERLVGRPNRIPVGDISAPTTGGVSKKTREQNRRDAEKAAEEQVRIALNALQTIYDAQLAYADKEIALAQTRIGIATTLAERGNTELLRLETERLDKAQRKRDEIGRKQIQLNNLITLSEQAKNVAEAIGAVIGAAKGDPYTLALRVIAAAAAIGAATATVAGMVRANNQGFAEGGYTGNGGKYQVKGPVHAGEFVFNQEKTSKYRAAFEAIHAGANPVLAFKGYHGGGSSVSMDDTNKRLDGVIDAINANQVNNRVFLNEHGVYAITERQQKLNRRRFGRG